MQNYVEPGSTLFIKGEITAQEPLSIAGRVDGTIEAQGQMVTIHAGAQVDADIAAAAMSFPARCADRWRPSAGSSCTRGPRWTAT